MSRTIHNGRLGPDGRVIGDLAPCSAMPRHNTVELLNGECFLCAQEREFNRAKELSPDNPAYNMRPFWEWDQ